MGAGRDPVVTEISVVESNLCSTLSTGCYFDAETQSGPFDRYGIPFGKRGRCVHERDRRFKSVSLQQRVC